MPNWCYTQVCFKGKPDNIMRLKRDVELANEWSHRNPDFCNIRYFLSLSGFDTKSYEIKIDNILNSNFRGFIYDNALKPEECGSYILYYPTFETAWYMDNQLLQIISLIYDVEFSSYSEELNMGVFYKCRNGNVDTYDYDYLICPNYEQVEEIMEDDPLFEYYDTPVKIGEPETDKILDDLKNHNIDFETVSIPEDPVPLIHGVYYHFMNGVIYDDENRKKYQYPEVDPFNIYINQ